MKVDILVGADIVPTESNFDLFRKADREKLVGQELCQVLDDADYIIMNLEVPLTNHAAPIVKAGPNLIAPTDTIHGLKAINPYFYTLANNHILDQDQQGLESTLELLDMNGIAYAGVGDTLREASKPYLVVLKGIIIGIYCCAEHEFTLVSDKRAGANPYEPLDSFDHVRALREKCDTLIVLYHGGKEEYRYPSPMLQRIFRKFAEVGADYVVAQHTHCIGCMEKWEGGTLVYGQGNFLFDRSNSEYWQTSLLIKIEVDTDSKKSRCDFIPVRKEGSVCRAAQDEEKERILAEFKSRSIEILKRGFVEEQYSKFAKEMRIEYIYAFAGGFAKSFIVRVINKLSGYRLLDRMYRKYAMIAIENYVDCEAHRELVTRIARLESKS